jgi:ATP-dependent DNA helicase RecG
LQSKLASTAISQLKGVGPKVAEKLNRLGILNVEDLLFHLPFRYQDKSKIQPMASLRNGEITQVCGQIESVNIVFGKRRALVCKISDGSGLLEVRLFYFSMAQKNQLIQGQYLQCYGQVTSSGRGFGMVHPELTFLKDDPKPQLVQGLQAVYPTTEGLQQRSLQKLMLQGLRLLKQNQPMDLIPQSWLAKLDFPCLSQALAMLHQPPLDISLNAIQQGEHPLIKRLAFEELLAQHIALTKIKNKLQRFPAFAIKINPSTAEQFKATLPFQLTQAQQRVITEIQQDLKNDYPMMRLVQGDVGSGKTLVAALNALAVAENNFQTALMAPTEILAEQHFKSFQTWFKPLGINVGLLISKMPTAEKKQCLKQLACGEIKILIGTHAVFQNQVNFSKLALVIIDEQHRFGVEQRKTLIEKGRTANDGKYQPHQLVMTATPIPRTLAQTAYADLDLSVIDELPPGRKPITTVAISDAKREQVIQRVEQAIRQDKRQVYWVCTLIDESEELQCQAAEATFEQLKLTLQNISVGLIHGRMKGEEKQNIMTQFKAGQIDLLIATTVIEVGVDVANASLMIIENPERLGLSQLHQLRGRVGRGETESHCLLMYHPPLSKNAQQRLNVMRETNDGFVVAEKDLELRGPGEVLGTRQTGILEYKFADIIRDSGLLTDVYLCADDVLQTEPKLAEALTERWVKNGEDLSRV